MRIKILLFILINFTASSLLYSFGDKETDNIHPEEKLNFLYVPGINDPFYYAMEKGLHKAAEQYNVNISVSEYPEYWDYNEQIEILNRSIETDDYDLVIIAPTSADALIKPLKELHDSGIEIITVDTFLGDGDYSRKSNYSFPLAYIGTDNYLGGFRVAEQLAKLLDEKGKVYMVNTVPGTSSVMAREKGFTAGITQYPNMELIGVDYCLNNQQIATELTLKVLQEEPEISGIFGVNVFSAQGSYKAVVETGLTGTIKIASWDATQKLYHAMKDGQIDLLLAQKPEEMGALSIEWAYRFFKEDMEIPKKIVPGFEFFTAENVNNPEMQKFIYK